MKGCREVRVLDVRLMILLIAVFVVAEGKTTQPPKILSKRTLLDVDDDDIGHFACEAHGIPKPSLRWEKDGIQLKESTRGISILTTRARNITTKESHLFIAVIGEYSRGEYLCVASNEEGVATQSFSVKETPPNLTAKDNIAITLSIFLTVMIISTIAILLRRRLKQLKKEKNTLINEEKKATAAARRHRPRLDTIEEEEKESFIPKTEPDEEKILSDGTNKPASCEVQVDLH